MRRLFESAIFTVTVALLWAAILLPSATAQARSKRLILKDGSYQAASKWEIKGDRVRYLSSERYEWEEIPKALIDWPATEKYNAGIKPESEETKQAEAEDKAAREAEEAASPTVAPGLRLPETGGVFLLDTFNGQPQLDELVQNGSEINQNRTKNILRATINPLASAKQTIEVKGQHATVQSHVNAPTIYVNVNQPEQSASAAGQTGAAVDTAGDLDQQPDRYKIAKLESKKDVRVLGSVNISMIGRAKQQQKFVPAKLEAMPGGWVKITPSQPLTPGEYALVEMLNGQEMNLYVWDFGVNPSAPANPTAWKPEPVPSTQTGTQETPVLKRPK